MFGISLLTIISDDLRISTSHETNGQAYLRRVPALAREFVYQNYCMSFVVYLPNKILTIILKVHVKCFHLSCHIFVI